MLQSLVFAVSALFIGVLAGKILFPAKKPVPSRYLLMYDGQLLTATEVVMKAGSLFLKEETDLSGGYELPPAAITSTFRLNEFVTLHVSGIERIALLQHAQLDRLRLSILQQSIPEFEQQSPILPLIRFVSFLVPVVVSLVLLFQFLSLGTQLQELATAVAVLQQLIREGVPVR